MITGKYKPEQFYKRSTPPDLLTNYEIHYFVNINHVSLIDRVISFI